MAEMSPRNGVEEGAWQGCKWGRGPLQIRAQNEVGPLRENARLQMRYIIKIYSFTILIN